MQAAYAELGYGPGEFPLALQLAGDVLSLPIGPQLLPSDARRVIDAVKSAVK
jgi:dTDP-4-amino-4,6-dideoxygalactose transaminase